MHLLSAGDIERGLRVMLDEHVAARACIASLEAERDAIAKERTEWREKWAKQDIETASARELAAMMSRVLSACEERDTCQVCRASYGPEQLRTHCAEHITPVDLNNADLDACQEWTAMLAEVRALLARIATKTEGA